MIIQKTDEMIVMSVLVQESIGMGDCFPDNFGFNQS
jgi:hypothetical protein